MTRKTWEFVALLLALDWAQSRKDSALSSYTPPPKWWDPETQRWRSGFLKPKSPEELWDEKLKAWSIGIAATAVIGTLPLMFLPPLWVLFLLGLAALWLAGVICLFLAERVDAVRTWLRRPSLKQEVADALARANAKPSGIAQPFRQPPLPPREGRYLTSFR